jgi:hypothetical protein
MCHHAKLGVAIIVPASGEIMGSGHADFPPEEMKELEWIPSFMKQVVARLSALHCQLYFYTQDKTF